MNYKALAFTLVMSVSAVVGNVAIHDYDNDVRCMFMSRKEICFKEAQEGILTQEMLAGLPAEDRGVLKQDITLRMQGLKEERMLTKNQYRLAKAGAWLGGLGMVGSAGMFGWYAYAWNDDAWTRRLNNREAVLMQKYIDGDIALHPEFSVKDAKNSLVKASLLAENVEPWWYAGKTAASYIGLFAAAASLSASAGYLNMHNEAENELNNLKAALATIAATPVVVQFSA